jgi:hypothetical protein
MASDSPASQERVSDQRLTELLALTIGRDTRRCLQELQQRRRQEFICPRCHLRHDPPKEDHGF